MTDIVQTRQFEYERNGWNDQLKNIIVKDENGSIISLDEYTYDSLGNPLQYGDASLTWFGRQLESYSNGDTSVSYTYNDQGIRTTKTVNDQTIKYYVYGDQVLSKLMVHMKSCIHMVKMDD